MPACVLARGVLRAAAALAVLSTAPLPNPALARPVQLEDLLQREGLGAAAFSPDGGAVVVERRGPYAAGGRFDLERFSDIARTTLWTASGDGGAWSPLFPPEPGAGYELGPFSPDGRRLAVFRLKDDAWRLGVVDLAARRATWLPVAPEYNAPGRSVQWRGPGELFVVTTPDDDLPRVLRYRNEGPRKLPARWAATRDGQGAHTVFGAGRYLDARPHAPPRRLVRVDLAGGRIETLARGDFTDLELSPDGRWAALLEAGDDIRLRAGVPLQGDYGLATRRQRLRLLDLRSGRMTTPDPGADVLPLLAWSPGSAELLIYSRRDGEPWTAGRFWRVQARSGAARPADDGVVPELDWRPELVSAGWLGEEPVVFGRRRSEAGGRAAWRRLGDGVDGPLAGAFRGPAPVLEATSPDAIVVAGGGRRWRIDRGGRCVDLGPTPALPGAGGLPGRVDRAPRRLAMIADRAPILDAPAGARWLARSDDGRRGLVRVFTRGGAEDLLLLRPSAAPARLAALNPALAEVDPPVFHRIDHPGPGGEPLHSWLLLPATRAGEAPLVILPYLGARYPAPPATADWRRAATPPTAALLASAGYAVLVPSLPVAPGAADPAAGVASRLLDLAERAARDPAAAGRVDAARIGLWGISYGGYTVLSAITQSKRFRAAIAQAAPSQLLSLHSEFHPHWRVSPDQGLEAAFSMGWVESDQGRMAVPPWEAPSTYVRNSPALQAQRIATPLLLAHGDQDTILHAQAEAMFSALYRQDKDAMLVTYWGEGHVIRAPGNLRDLYARALAFLGQTLRPQAAGR